jgi:spermidine synthase
MTRWVEEQITDAAAIRYPVVRCLHRSQSAYQTIEIVETSSYGRMLLIDGLVMLSEWDEWIYHEMISHVPLCTHPSAREVLIVGGGDGGTAREVMRHTNVEVCTVAEIDRAVIDACERFLPMTACGFEDTRVKVEVGDGVEFLRRCDRMFDVILVDSSDPVGPATALFGDEFLDLCQERLREDGVLALQVGSPFYHRQSQADVLQRLGRRFRHALPYTATIPTYPGGLWTFAYAAQQRTPLPAREIESAALRYYSAEVHRAAFVLPNFLRNLVRDGGEEVKGEVSERLPGRLGLLDAKAQNGESGENQGEADQNAHVRQELDGRYGS